MLSQHAQQRRRLIQTLLILRAGGRIADNAASGAETDPTSLLYQGSNGHIRIHCPVETDIPDCSAVDATTVLFQFFDNFHGATLGSPGNGPAG